MGLQVGQVLRQAARFAPDAIAVVDLGHPGAARREISYAGLHRMACQMAHGLAARGVRPGDRVALVAENSIEVAAAWFGVVYAGAAVVPLHLLSAALELAQRFEHAGVKIALHDGARAELVREAAARAGATQALQLDALDPLEQPAQPAQHYPLDTSPADTALVLYTSGTTGKAKGAAVSHASLMLHTVLLVQHALELSQASRVLCALPLSHSYGCRLAMLAPFYARACIVIMPRFEARRALAALQEEHVTWLPVVPTMLSAIAQISAAGEPLSAAAASLRWVLCAGAPLSDETARRAEAVLGVEVRQGYGMTEATFSTMNAPPDQRVLGSVGKPLWGIELRVLDEQRRDVPAGQRGQVVVRGHNVMTHYLFDAEATAEAAPDGWVYSGDVGELDAEGRLRIVDRIKELIIRGGYNVYPSEVENALGAHPDVHDVAVLGRPDAFYGEEVVATVVLREGASCGARELSAFAAQRLSRTKLPREYAFVSQLPLGASGKIHKLTLLEQLLTGRLTVQKVGV